jgi:integrase
MRRAGIKLSTVVDEYYTSLAYRSLAPITQKDYKYCLDALLATQLNRLRFAVANIGTVTPPHAQAAYNIWAERGVPFANHILAVGSKVWNYAIQLGYTELNPFSKVSRRPHRPRKMVWTREDINLFLTTAYSQFRWRSVGLIVQMAYEWCQRLGDMTNLTWDKYDFDKRVLYLEQSKRRAKVELPTTDELHEMLVQQQEEVGFQPYVAPVCYVARVLSSPYNKHTLSMSARNVMRAAGLSEELQIMDMRRTGTVEMVDAGVPLPQIMAITGHANPQSVKPYLKNTLTSATEAAKLRFAHRPG